MPTGYGIDADSLVFLGYSSGANLLAVTVQLHPGVVRRAVLLRGIQALEDPPDADLSGTSVLVLSGRDNSYAGGAAELASALTARGASVEVRELPAAHEPVAADAAETSRWLDEIFR